MSTAARFLLTITVLAITTSCRKEVETVVVQQVDKVYSWTEVKQLAGIRKIIVGMNKDAQSLYLQQAGSFGIISPQHNPVNFTYNQYYTSTSLAAAGELPFDISVRLPLGPAIYACPLYLGDSVLIVRPNSSPISFSADRRSSSEIHLRRLDPHAVRYVNNKNYDFFQFGAINSNNYLLFGYLTDNHAQDPAIRFVLSKVSLSRLTAGNSPTAFATADSRTLRLPLPGQSSGYLKSVAAIENYFIADCTNLGLFKITQDGTIRKVHGPTYLTTLYKWQGVIYGVVGDGKSILTSKDEGETWQESAGVPSFFQSCTFYPVGDSLVAISHHIATNSLFTLRWQGNNYRLRELKNDGLGQVDFSDLAQLGDTVYMATNSGLFKRPLKQFFDNKQ